MAEPTESDPLAETAAADGSDTGPGLGATATAAPSEPRAPVAIGASPTTIGRYLIDGVLGQGAMGVVYAARDPDLDRRVALKVLRGGGTDAARARLLREARAMARLAHPAVVTVHEVGTAGGVDYVAMELIDGTTVAEWIRGDKPGGDDILAVLEVAGRGLAAAHAAGLVHRDFKPHNVLRSRTGKVVVTDFGLARAALDEPDPAPGGQPARRDGAVDAGSLSSTLTATGAVLGTPAYMAPEQHDGAGVGPAADQFAYCVTMWEALAGARPFPGETMGAVRVQIERGPDPAGEAAIPRRLRAPLRRGLSADPHARFPSMDALLAAIRPPPRRAWALAGAGAIAVAAVVTVAVVRGRAPVAAAAPGCGPPDRELARFLTSPARATLATTAHGSEVLRNLDRYAADWRKVQPGLCARTADPARGARLGCLRAVRADLDRTLAGAAAVDPAKLGWPIDQVGDPLACAAPRPPNRVVMDDPASLALETALARLDDGGATDPGPAVPCLRVLYLMAQLGQFERLGPDELHADLVAASEAADLCGDDRLSAGVTIMSISTEPALLSNDPASMRRVNAAIDRSGGDRMFAAIGGLLDGITQGVAGKLDGAIERLTGVVEASTAIGLHGLAATAAEMTARWRLDRGGPDDAARAEGLLRIALDTEVENRPRIARSLVVLLEELGKPDEAATVAARIVEPQAPAAPGSIAVHGRVLDEAGRPVAGARVVADERVIVYPDGLDRSAPAEHTAVTGSDGTFTIAWVSSTAMVMASLDTRRAFPVKPAPEVALRFHPTGSVHGRIVRAATPQGHVRVDVELQPAPLDVVEFTAPIGADGRFQIDHVPQGKGHVVVIYGGSQRRSRHADVTVGPGIAGPVAVDITDHGHALQLVVRNQADTALTYALAWVMRGRFTGTTVHDLPTAAIGGEGYPGRVEDAPVPVRSIIHAGDIAVTVPGIEPGDVTVCAVGITGNLMETDFRLRLNRHLGELALGCVAVTVADTDHAVVVEVPAMKRLPP